MNIFTKHPHSLQETYFQHLQIALTFGIQMTFGGIACLIHAFFPFLFEKTASNLIIKLHKAFLTRNPMPLSD